MNEDRIKEFIGKKAKIFLKNMPRHYTAEVLSVQNGTVEIKDKFNKIIPIDCDIIGLIEEIYDDGKMDGGDYANKR